jgi:ABC-type nitrate/sulfonate/bicarbonate transport system substrate-binding protein
MLEATPNSITQMTDLSEGKFEIAMTAVDNIVAYVEGQGEAPIGSQPDFFAFMGSDSGFLHLVAAPDIRSVKQLKGRTVSVDALTTGYAFVLFEILRRAGLSKSDYEVERVGGMVQRWRALMEGRQDATILSSPYHYLAMEKGFRTIATATDVLGSYQGNVAASRRSWAASHKEKLISFVRGYGAGVEWLADAAHQREAMEILVRQAPGISEDLASRAYAELLHPAKGFSRGGRINMAGFRTVLELRTRYGQPSKSLQDPLIYCDLSILDSARNEQPRDVAVQDP